MEDPLMSCQLRLQERFNGAARGGQLRDLGWHTKAYTGRKSYLHLKFQDIFLFYLTHKKLLLYLNHKIKLIYWM